MNNSIKDYYNNLAKNYDEDRFGNSYGQFIDIEEKAIVRRILGENLGKKTLDIACGTGRFLEFATHGIDISPEMIAVSKNKFPDKDLRVDDAEKTSFERGFFDEILSFHLFMHLDEQSTKNVLDEAHRMLKKGGTFVFDLPSEKRRNLLGKKPKGWHGTNSMSVKTLKTLIGDKWKLVEYSGILFLPIHQFPKKSRASFIEIDKKLCHSFMREYSSYLIFHLEKL